MRYALLIYHDETEIMQYNDAQNEALVEAHWKLFNEMKEADVIQPGGPALEPTTQAVSIRVRNDQMLTTDGPFAETKEQLGGLYIVKCDTIEEAIQWAAKIPEARRGTVEVRPIVEFDM